MKKSSKFIIAAVLMTLIAGCFNVDKTATEMTPLFQGIECLNQFYLQKNRLPADNDELIAYVGTIGTALDLSGLTTFAYKMNSDSTYTLEYEISTHVKGKGTFIIRPGEVSS